MLPQSKLPGCVERRSETQLFNSLSPKARANGFRSE